MDWDQTALKSRKPSYAVWLKCVKDVKYTQNISIYIQELHVAQVSYHWLITFEMKLRWIAGKPLYWPGGCHCVVFPSGDGCPGAESHLAKKSLAAPKINRDLISMFWWQTCSVRSLCSNGTEWIWWSTRWQRNQCHFLAWKCLDKTRLSCGSSTHQDYATGMSVKLAAQRRGCPIPSCRDTSPAKFCRDGRNLVGFQLCDPGFELGNLPKPR